MSNVGWSELSALLTEKKVTLITANTRLMQYFQDLFFQRKISPVSVIESPNIFSYDVWLEQCWQSIRKSPPFKKGGRCLWEKSSLITPLQSHFLWEKIIEKNNPFFFNTQGVIEEAKKAWKLCWAWNIEITEKIFSSNIDTSTFLQWASHYASTLKKNNWIDKEMLPAILREITAHSTAMKNNFVLAGFDRLSPSMMHLLEKLSLDKPRIYENAEKAYNVSKVAYLSEDEEIQAFLSWAKNHPADKNIACVVPNLNEKRNKLERFIQRHFQEEEYNISAGHMFSSCPMIAAALRMLSIKIDLIKKRPVILKDFYFILENRYVGNTEEEIRSSANKAVHATENAQLSWKNFLVILKKNHVGLLQQLEAFESVIFPQKAKLHEWSAIFHHVLESLNWPGSYALNSEAYQTYERWLALLQEFQQLNLLFEEISSAEAFSLLQKMANQAIFQAKKSSARIHFLGVLEAAGLHFDAVWITGMTAEKFPGKVQLNPFIPFEIQRQYALPHATHEVEREFSQKLMHHFITGGYEVIFSYASQKKGIKIEESALIQSIPLSTISIPKVDAQEFLSLEIMHDEEAFPCLPHENIKGGTSLIKNQALCPFRAFAKHRLRASGFENLTLGLNDHERGSLVHEVLEKFWKETQTQQRLLQYSQEELDTLIYSIISQSVKKIKSDKLSPFLQKLEIKRLERLLKKWLEYEKKRPTFSIAALEEAQLLHLSKLELNIRVDRIDTLFNGKKMIIDYKTGVLPSLSYDDERPEHPQLLLYALSDPDVNALAFAQVKPSEPLLKGQAAEETDIQGIKSIDWNVERERWKLILTALADEFLQGKNQALPKREAVCNTCDLHGLCRIREIG